MTTVVWQLTRTCDLGCNDCPTDQERLRHHTRELTTYEAYQAIDQIAAIKPQRFVISGGDPFARPDLFELVQYARRRGLDPAVNVSPTWRLTAENISRLRRNGLTRLIFSINGSTPRRHDATVKPRSFATTARGMRWARDAGIKVEVNTCVTQKTVSDLAAIAEMIDPFDIDGWNVYFFVPFPARSAQSLTAQQAEEAFAALSAISSLARYRVRIFEAPQYRRFLMQQAGGDAEQWPDFQGYLASDQTVDDVVFITSQGHVWPSEFLPLTGGNVIERPLTTIIHSSDLFAALRDRSNLRGKCGRCEYRDICGGSRARAWAVTGDLFAPDPLCAYQPSAMEVAI